MPKSLVQMIESIDEIAKKIDEYEPRLEDELDMKIFHELRAVAERRVELEQEVCDLVVKARAGGYSWSMIGSLLGTSGEAARQRYGRTPTK